MELSNSLKYRGKISKSEYYKLNSFEITVLKYQKIRNKEYQFHIFIEYDRKRHKIIYFNTSPKIGNKTLAMILLENAHDIIDWMFK